LWRRQITEVSWLCSVSDFPHPYPGVPRFPGKHLAQVVIDNYKQRGHIRRCAHLRLGEWGGMIDAPEYGPECLHNSFTIIPSTGQYDPDPDGFYGCPKNCRFFRPSWIGRLGRGSSAAWRVALSPFTALVWFLKWYQVLPAVTQVALLLLILLLVGFVNWQQVVEILNAARGK
jgi:hypothetical protein